MIACTRRNACKWAIIVNNNCVYLQGTQFYVGKNCNAKKQELCYCMYDKRKKRRKRKKRKKTKKKVRQMCRKAWPMGRQKFCILCIGIVVDSFSIKERDQIHYLVMLMWFSQVRHGKKKNVRFLTSWLCCFLYTSITHRTLRIKRREIYF